MIFWWIGIALAAPVQGRVIERGSSTPVAEVVVRGAGGVEVTTGPDGRFTLDLNLDDDGLGVLRIDDPDYLPVTFELRPPVDRLRIFVEPVPLDRQVVVEGLRPSAHPTVHRLDAEQAYKTPGTQDDAVRLIQSLPGVTTQREFSPTSGDLSIRGSAPADNRVFLDGVEIPYLYHFNQYASVFPTSWLRGLELYPSTFGARYGDAVGGVIEAESRFEPPAHVQGQISVNTIIAGAELRAPLGKGWWMAVAGRRSYQDLYSRGSDQYTVWPIFHDLAVRLERGDAERGTGIFFVRAGDRWDRAIANLDLLDPVEAERTPQLRYRRRFDVLGLRHRWRGERSRGRLVVAAVHDDLSGRITSGGSQRERSITLSSRLDVEGGIAQSPHQWGAGWEVRGGLTGLNVTPEPDAGLLVLAEAPAIARGAAVQTTVPRLQVGAYGETQLVLGSLRLIPGIRLGADSLTRSALPEPRAALRLRPTDSTALKLALGRYLQTGPILNRVEGTGRPEAPVTKAWQVAAGVEQVVAERLEINLDAYAKDLRDVLVLRPDGPPDLMDQGRALGAELVLRYRLRERFFVWGWAGVGRAQVRRGPRWASDAFDQPINLGIVASWDPHPRWNVAVRWRWGSGLPWTPVQGNVYDASNDTFRPVLAEAFSARMPAYTKLDLAASRSFVFDRWTLDLRAEVWYVPPAANVLYPTWSDDWSEQGWVRGIPLLPLLGGRATF
ncbi:MAG: TonB-dependent receptor [Deltaproteobacteria bacterium]|nr:MAG: TonB-dependent receptor [Deltaproteobacteria bacterium]